MTKTARLSKRELEMLKKAWEILSRWSEAAEDNDEVDAYLYDVSMSAVASLCEFINNYEDDCLECLSEVYNIRRKTGRVYMRDAYRKAMEDKYSWYAKKWGKAKK